MLKQILTLITERSLPSAIAMTLALNAPTMTRAGRHLAFGDWNVAFRAFPSVFAVTNSAAVMTMSRAQNRADALRAIGALISIDAIALAQVA